MIIAENIYKIFKKNKINFFCGVPDSVLKKFTAYLSEKKIDNYILANEGSAVAMGIGNYLRTQKIPLIYMQNSGFGNSINPLISIAHKKVYKIPMILLIGWRGAPGSKDEPQHVVQGEITKKILKLCGIQYCELNNNKDLKKLENLIKFSKKNKAITACLIKNNSLSNNLKTTNKDISFKKAGITRKDFIKNLVKILNSKDKIVSSTGYISRELYNSINKLKLKIKPFYVVGGMGHASIISLGYSLKNKRRLICIDGDGSFLMHLGSAVSIGKYSGENFKYILLNNKVHESVGGQSTNIEKVKLKEFSKSVGYKKYFYIKNKNNCLNILKKFLKFKGSCFLEVNIEINKQENDLPRPKNFLKIKKDFLSI